MNSTLLFTGASGFLGSAILSDLSKLYTVTSIGIDKSDSLYGDIATAIPTLPHRYELVLHAAGKAHKLPKTEQEKQAFFDVNYQGTINLCLALERVGVPKSFIFLSTVAVYGCDQGENIDETHPLNGTTPYAKSKIMAEEFLQQWCSKHQVTLSIIRPSLIAGSSAPGNLGQMVKGIESGRYLRIAEGKARKSMIMAQDIARLIPLLAERGGTFNICDDSHPSFRELEESICTQLGGKRIVAIPYWFARSLAICGDLIGSRFPINSERLSKITHSLTFSNRRAKEELAWEPLNVLKHYSV